MNSRKPFRRIPVAVDGGIELPWKQRLHYDRLTHTIRVDLIDGALLEWADESEEQAEGPYGFVRVEGRLGGRIRTVRPWRRRQ